LVAEGQSGERNKGAVVANKRGKKAFDEHSDREISPPSFLVIVSIFSLYFFAGCMGRRDVVRGGGSVVGVVFLGVQTNLTNKI